MVTCRILILPLCTHGIGRTAPKTRMADSPGGRIGVPVSTPKTPTLVIESVPPLMSAGGVFPDFAYWAKSAEVLIMAILGGMGHFWGPAVGAAVLILLNQQITAYTQYWPFILGSILIVLLFVFPGGIVGALHAGLARIRRWRDA